MEREASALNGYLLEQLKASAKNLYGEYEQDEDAPLPTGWTRVSIGEIAEMVCRGITPKYSVDSDEFVLGQTCIRDNLVLVENSRAHSPKKVTEKRLHKYDLLINSTGVGSLGRTAQIWFEPSKLVVDSHVTIVRTAKPSHALYLGFWAFGHEKFIESLHTGSTGQTELPREHVKAISVVLPDDKTLAAFNTMASPSVELIAANQEENKRLVALRDALLPKLMSGKIDVSEVNLTQLNSHLAALWSCGRRSRRLSWTSVVTDANDMSNPGHRVTLTADQFAGANPMAGDGTTAALRLGRRHRRGLLGLAYVQLLWARGLILLHDALSRPLNRHPVCAPDGPT